MPASYSEGALLQGAGLHFTISIHAEGARSFIGGNQGSPTEVMDSYVHLHHLRTWPHILIFTLVSISKPRAVQPRHTSHSKATPTGSAQDPSQSLSC